VNIEDQSVSLPMERCKEEHAQVLLQLTGNRLRMFEERVLPFFDFVDDLTSDSWNRYIKEMNLAHLYEGEK
jgi:hypothetical protein